MLIIGATLVFIRSTVNTQQMEDPRSCWPSTEALTRSPQPAGRGVQSIKTISSNYKRGLQAMEHRQHQQQESHSLPCNTLFGFLRTHTQDRHTRATPKQRVLCHGNSWVVHTCSMSNSSPCTSGCLGQLLLLLSNVSRLQNTGKVRASINDLQHKVL